MSIQLPTLSDFEHEGKRILMRVDINSPLEPMTKTILDDSRFRGHLETLRELSDARVVLMAHQSRPGLEDFTTLERHAEKLEELLGSEVVYVDEIIGSSAKRAIENMKPGDVLLLENVRFLSEETADAIKKKPPAEQAKTIFVRKLASWVDVYVNDAFAVSHRSQPSVVGFPQVLPSYAGRLLEKEVKTLSRVAMAEERPRVFCFGGAKFEDSLKVVERVLTKNIADVVLTSGMIANLFLLAKGLNIGKVNAQPILAKGREYVERAKKLLKKYGDRIKTPVDVAVKKNSSRVEVRVENIPDLKIMDIGIETIGLYSSIIAQAGVVTANGPAGVFEVEGFSLGSEELVKALAKSKAFTCIGGGHLSAIASRLRVKHRLSFVSTGGKAFLLFLSGEKLPGIEVLRGGS